MYHVLHETSARQLWEILEERYLTKSVDSQVQLKRRLYRFQTKRECSINEHMNNYTKLLTELIKMDVEIDEEDKTVILLINRRKFLNYNEVSAALVNYKVRRQDRLSSSGSTTAGALMIGGRSFNRKDRGCQGRSKSSSGFRDMQRNQYALCKELGHWKVDCLKAKDKKKELMTEENLAQVVSTHASTSQVDGSDSDSSVFSFFVTTATVGYSDNSEWILNTGATFMCARTGTGFLALKS